MSVTSLPGLIQIWQNKDYFMNTSLQRWVPLDPQILGQTLAQRRSHGPRVAVLWTQQSPSHYSPAVPRCHSRTGKQQVLNGDSDLIDPDSTAHGASAPEVRCAATVIMEGRISTIVTEDKDKRVRTEKERHIKRGLNQSKKGRRYLRGTDRVVFME